MRAPPLLLLLLMAAAGLAVSPLTRLNPWLSACDLEEESASGVRKCGGATCGGGGAATTLTKDIVPGLCAEKNNTKLGNNLKPMHLRVCCERSPISVLNPDALDEMYAGVESCERVLLDVINLDAMVERVHCDFVNILDRYDCDQSYSVHTCDQCQQTYRRWACSTMVPLWAKWNDSSQKSASSACTDPPPAPAANSTASGQQRRHAPTDHASRWRARHLERVGHLDRRRRSGVLGRWVRSASVGPGRPKGDLGLIKPCLSVCQLVEQHCPYFLPADRAPAYPTQYAGEPTFLCVDSRIPETGAQATKSNYGTEECCHWYCPDGKRIMENNCAERAPMELPIAEQCVAVEERVPTCAVPYQAPGAAPRAQPAQRLALLATALLVALASAYRSRTHWTPSTSLVNVRDSRL